MTSLTASTAVERTALAAAETQSLYRNRVYFLFKNRNCVWDTCLPSKQLLVYLQRNCFRVLFEFINCTGRSKLHACCRSLAGLLAYLASLLEGAFFNQTLHMDLPSIAQEPCAPHHSHCRGTSPKANQKFFMRIFDPQHALSIAVPISNSSQCKSLQLLVSLNYNHNQTMFRYETIWVYKGPICRPAHRNKKRCAWATANKNRNFL